MILRSAKTLLPWQLRVISCYHVQNGSEIVSPEFGLHCGARELQATTIPNETGDTRTTQRITHHPDTVEIADSTLEMLQVGTKLGHDFDCFIAEVTLIDAVIVVAQIEELRSHGLGRVCDAVTRDVPHICTVGREVYEGLGSFDEIGVLHPPSAARVSHVPHLQTRTGFRDGF
jgi:hypothetical protein